MAYIFSDLNVRDSFVTDSTDVMIYDTKTVIQSLWRLITTEEGEIPNFRNYGLNIKQFSQYPLTSGTVDTIYNYVKGKAEAFEGRADIIRADVSVDFKQGNVSMWFYARLKSTGEVVKLPTWVVQVSTS